MTVLLHKHPKQKRVVPTYSCYVIPVKPHLTTYQQKTISPQGALPLKWDLGLQLSGFSRLRVQGFGFRGFEFLVWGFWVSGLGFGDFGFFGFG